MDVQTPRPSWRSRNWKWVAPVAVLAGVALTSFAVLGTYFVVTFFLHAMKSSGGYQEALATARSNPAAVQALGTPIKDGWFPTGSVQSSGTTGESDLAIPVSGPRAKGTLYVRATKSMGAWRFTRLVLQVKGTGEQIDLLAGTAP
jgi:hypothetical protein